MAVGRSLILVALGVMVIGSVAHGQTDEDRAFVEAAYAAANFQRQISEIAAGKDLRLEAKTFAVDMLQFRTAQLTNLRNLAGKVGVGVKETLDRELTAIIANLQPLDSLAMSRRYLEAETGILSKELEVYDRAGRLGSEEAKRYVESFLNRLQELQKDAAARAAAVYR